VCTQKIFIILASQSPRRRELLEGAGIPCTPIPAAIDESTMPGEAPEALVQRLAALKADTVAPQYPDQIVLGSDTIVYLHPEILGKPADLNQARSYLRALSGKTHHVYTGVCMLRLRPAWRQVWHTVTTVTFRSLDDDDIENYLQLTQPLDKAGAYAIQEHGELIIDGICGLRSNVIGLPIEEVIEQLKHA
jgi:septum formation protein